ncbi:MAG: DUF805 domain-containing protein [Chromatiales bacterium]|nr:DUF805 domain-containing protein [Chromatiales bacterium]
MRQGWRLLSPGGRLKRRPYFLAVLGIGLLGVSGGYLVQHLLLREDYVSPCYLEITFLWGLLILGAITPFSVQRARDIGISGWWVSFLWLPPFFDLKFILILSKYTGAGISGHLFWLALLVGVTSLIVTATLFFQKVMVRGMSAANPNKKLNNASSWLGCANPSLKRTAVSGSRSPQKVPSVFGQSASDPRVR